MEKFLCSRNTSAMFAGKKISEDDYKKAKAAKRS